MAHTCELWEVDMLYYEPNGSYLSHSSANYPTLMNVELAMRIVIQAGLNRCARTQAHSMVAIGRWSNCLFRKDMVYAKRIRLTPTDWVGNNPMDLRWIAPVKSKSGELPHSRHSGDRRNLVDSVTMIPDHSRCGKVIYDLLSGYLAQHRHVQEPCLESIAKDIAEQKEVIDDNMLLPLRQLVLQTFTTHGIPFWITRPSLAPWRYLDFCVWTTTTCLGSFSQGPRSGRCTLVQGLCTSWHCQGIHGSAEGDSHG